MTIDVVIVAAGAGTRSERTVPKAYTLIGGQPVLRHAIDRMQAHPQIRRIVVVYDPAHQPYVDTHTWPDGLVWVHGGATRAASVYQGLNALRDDPPAYVFIHDAARAFMPTAVIDAIRAALEQADGAVPVLPIADSLKRVASGSVTEDTDRSAYALAQTPQGFRYAPICAAYAHAEALITATDDVAVARAAGLTVVTVPGHSDGFKLTYPDDFARAARLFFTPQTRVGSGYDVHRLGSGDHVWLCGVKIPHTHGLIGHSDADVALHAATDAVLGAMALGDIGQHFPPSDPQWRGASSGRFLSHALDLIRAQGGHLTHLDITIICEAPKVGPHRDAMRQRVADICGVDIRAISVKATTTEGLGLTGRREGIAAQATATVQI